MVSGGANNIFKGQRNSPAFSRMRRPQSVHCAARYPLAGMLDFAAYLERVGLTAGELPTLQAIHRAHATSIPLENLDPYRGIPVSLAGDSFFGSGRTNPRAANGDGGLFLARNGTIGTKAPQHAYTPPRRNLSRALPGCLRLPIRVSAPPVELR
jgi:hypothetical protein